MGNGVNICIHEDGWLKKEVIGGPTNHDEPQIVANLINKENKTWKE